MVTMQREGWSSFIGKVWASPGGVYQCSCCTSLWTQQALREHWQMGHFDTVASEAVTWTTDKPTKEGFYWLRWGGHEPAPVEVRHDGYAHMCVSYCGSDQDAWVENQKGEWFGPVEAPA